MLRPQGDRGMAAVVHGDLLDLPAARTAARAEHAVDWLVDTYMASEGDITLVAVGPLTNVAMALLKEPRMAERIPEIVIMGGAHESGNRTASAEYNFWVDPEAARIVVECGRPIRMVPLDATHRAPVSLDDCARLRALGTAAANASAAIVEQRIHGYNATQPMAGVRPRRRSTTPWRCAPSSNLRCSRPGTSGWTSRRHRRWRRDARSAMSARRPRGSRTSSSPSTPTGRGSWRCWSRSSVGSTAANRGSSAAGRPRDHAAYGASAFTGYRYMAPLVSQGIQTEPKATTAPSGSRPS